MIESSLKVVLKPFEVFLDPEPVDTGPLPVRDHIFISYSRKDKKWLEKLLTMLTPLQHTGLLGEQEHLDEEVLEFRQKGG